MPQCILEHVCEYTGFNREETTKKQKGNKQTQSVKPTKSNKQNNKRHGHKKRILAYFLTHTDIRKHKQGIV